MKHSKIYYEIDKLSIRPEKAKYAALKEIEKMETNKQYARKVKFNPLEWRIQLAFAWDPTPENLRKLWPQLSVAQINKRLNPIKI